MLEPIFYLLRRKQEWPTATAVVEYTAQGFRDRNGPRTTNVYFTYSAAGSAQNGKLNVDTNSSLYWVQKGSQFDIRFNPDKPERFYCAEAVTMYLLFKLCIYAIAVPCFLAYVLIKLLLR
jgi:hypothetical protein